jgi:hypothetical protein
MLSAQRALSAPQRPVQQQRGGLQVRRESALDRSLAARRGERERRRRAHRTQVAADAPLLGPCAHDESPDAAG